MLNGAPACMMSLTLIMAGLLILILEIPEKRKLEEVQMLMMKMLLGGQSYAFFLGEVLEAQELFCTGRWPQNQVRDLILTVF